VLRSDGQRAADGAGRSQLLDDRRGGWGIAGRTGRGQAVGPLERRWLVPAREQNRTESSRAMVIPVTSQPLRRGGLHVGRWICARSAGLARTAAWAAGSLPGSGPGLLSA